MRWCQGSVPVSVRRSSRVRRRYSTSPLGTIGTVDTGKQLQAGIGTGVGKALDRLSQYYITLAEKMFPIIEVDAGRTVDVVFTKGFSLETEGASGRPIPTPTSGAGGARSRRSLWNPDPTVNPTQHHFYRIQTGVFESLPSHGHRCTAGDPLPCNVRHPRGG
jgi:hypothetical protein